MIALVLIIALFVSVRLAKRGSGRRKPNFSKYLKGNVDESINLGTLASLTLVSANFDESPDEQLRCSSVKGTWSLDLLTPGQGPIMVGLAHSDYSDAEIEAVIENTGSWDRGNKIQQEVAKRLVRRVGIFSTAGGGVSTDQMVLNDGKPITTKLNWRLITGATLKLWAYNMGPDALATTAPIVRLQGQANLWF